MILKACHFGSHPSGKKDVGKTMCFIFYVTLVPYISAAGELKTKPTQHSVKELRSIGISPDIIVCRSEKPISKEMREKWLCSATLIRKQLSKPYRKKHL